MAIKHFVCFIHDSMAVKQYFVCRGSKGGGGDHGAASEQPHPPGELPEAH